ncbi:MAG: hypothetical protein GY796_02850 [Chloroflexi bacterium]|nr:hypothetical protein [Chloroflexota bacterium]
MSRITVAYGRMQTATIQTILAGQHDHTLGHVIYIVRASKLIFYVGQSKRDVAARFREHLQKPSRLGQLIELNQPESDRWLVQFYTMADCRPFVEQKSLFIMQEWENFDMDMAEQNMIAQLHPVINRDFNPKPTPLPLRYQGQHLAAAAQTNIHAPQYRPWLNKMSLAGWVYKWDVNGRLTWQHSDGRSLPDKQMAPYRNSNRVP